MTSHCNEQYIHVKCDVMIENSKPLNIQFPMSAQTYRVSKLAIFARSRGMGPCRLFDDKFLKTVQKKERKTVNLCRFWSLCSFFCNHIMFLTKILFFCHLCWDMKISRRTLQENKMFHYRCSLWVLNWNLNWK